MKTPTCRMMFILLNIIDSIFTIFSLSSSQPVCVHPSSLNPEGPGIARKIVGREFLFRVHRIGDHFRIEDAVACNPSRIANSMVKELRVRRTALAKLTP
eukprot:1316861-Amorphochlora_amoeboformis.AAC.1